MVILIALLMLSGCATESLEERALACQPRDAKECVLLRKRADERFENKKFKCHDGQIIFKDQWGRFSCVSREDFERWRVWHF